MSHERTRAVFAVLDKIEDRMFDADAVVSPGGWSCNSCASSPGGDEPIFRPMPDEPDGPIFRPMPDGPTFRPMPD